MDSDTRLKMAFSLIVGGLYLVFGLVQVLGSFGMFASLIDTLNIDDNLFGGFVLLLIGVVYLFVVRSIKRDSIEGSAFLFTGIFLSLLYASINLVILGATLLSALLEGESLEVFQGITPIVYLGLLSLIGLYIWRSTFSFSRLSKAGV